MSTSRVNVRSAEAFMTLRRATLVDRRSGIVSPDASVISVGVGVRSPVATKVGTVGDERSPGSAMIGVGVGVCSPVSGTVTGVPLVSVCSPVSGTVTGVPLPSLRRRCCGCGGIPLRPEC